MDLALPCIFGGTKEIQNEFLHKELLINLDKSNIAISIKTIPEIMKFKMALRIMISMTE